MNPALDTETRWAAQAHKKMKMKARNEAISMLLAWGFSMCVPHVRAVQDEALLCLSRVAPLPKSEGYGSLCTSIAALYQQQLGAASSFLSLQEESNRTRASHAALERKTGALQQQNAELERRNTELEIKLETLLEHQINHEKQSQAANAQALQDVIARRDEEWHVTVRRLAAENEIMKKREFREIEKLKKRETFLQQKARKTREAMKQRETRLKKEAMVASTSALTEHKRSILLAGRHERLDRQSENKEARNRAMYVARFHRETKGLIAQIKALEKENAQLVKQCA